MAATLLHGQYYEMAKAGMVFSQSVTPLGTAIPIYTATNLIGVPVLWNPPQSGVSVELIQYSAARVSGTEAFGSIGLVARPLSAIATGSLCTALASSTPNNGYFGGGVASKCQSANAGQVTVTAGAAADLWVSMFAMLPAIDTTAVPPPPLIYDFNGMRILPPGYLVYPVGSVASVALFAQTLTWAEIPLV